MPDGQIWTTTATVVTAEAAVEWAAVTAATVVMAVGEMTDTADRHGHHAKPLTKFYFDDFFLSLHQIGGAMTRFILRWD